MNARGELLDRFLLIAGIKLYNHNLYYFELYYFVIGVTKYRNEAMVTPKEIELADFKNLPPKHIWTPEVKKGHSSIFIDERDPPVMIAHFAVAAGLWSVWQAYQKV